MNQKNFVLAIVLSLGFMVFWSVVVMPRLSPAPVVSSNSMESTLPPGAVPAVAGGTAAATAAPLPAKVQMVTLRNADNEIELDPRGGGIHSWKLSSKNQIFDLVLSPDAQPLPLASFPILFKMTAHADRVVMEGALPNGVHLIKTLSLSASGHLHHIEYRFKNPTSAPIVINKWDWGWGPGLGTVASEMKENAAQTRALSMGPIKAHVVEEGDHATFDRWVGLDNRYFLVAFLPTSAHASEFSKTGKKESTAVHLLEDTTVPAQGEALLAYDLYVGPKGYTQLKQYNQRLEASVDFGFFGPLGKLILSALYRLKAWTGNYGYAIILLTLILQVLLSPLTLKSFKAAQSMKRLQPKIARLQEMYKGDPKRLNTEMMNLYKTSGTNPFGGCLPMLLQLPIFWALFTTLRNAYELRGAPFVGWVHDLSIHDPLYILPVVMGGGMFLQQRMTGMTSDPTQKQMMYIMPVMFTVMFMNFPAGLVLYWLTNSVATISFQYFYMRATTGTPDRPEIVKP